MQRDIDPPGTPNTENLFYFLVEITVENCGGTDLTGVELLDSFSNEAQPFATSATQGSVTLDPPTPDPSDGMVKESLTWTIGTLAASSSSTLSIKVGTEFNPPGRLEPTSFEQSIFFNGQDDQTGSASVTTNEGLSASVGAMPISIGDDLETCEDTDGEWDLLDAQSGPNIKPHKKCAAVTTSLPLEYSDGTMTLLSAAPSQAPAVETRLSHPSHAPRRVIRRHVLIQRAGSINDLLDGTWWMIRRGHILL